MWVVSSVYDVEIYYCMSDWEVQRCVIMDEAKENTL